MSVQYLDPTLRSRVVEAAEALVDAFDQASGNPTPDAIEDLRQAADESMRAIARVMLVLEQEHSTNAPGP